MALPRPAEDDYPPAPGSCSRDRHLSTAVCRWFCRSGGIDSGPVTAAVTTSATTRS